MPIHADHINIEQIDPHNHPEFMDHEAVFKMQAPEANFTAFVGVHSTKLGPSLGGIRYKNYADENEALGDVLRLSEAMTWKNAVGKLHHGGGKSVIMAPANEPKPNAEMLEIFAQGLNKLNNEAPLYFGAEDMNMSEDALSLMGDITSWLKGVPSKDPQVVSGSPSPLTAMGVFECIKVAARHKLGTDTLHGVRISLQGLGNVGAALALYLHKDGAILMGCDINDQAFADLKAQGVEIEKVDLDEIYDVPADIFAPNAIGGTLSDANIERLKKAGVKIICGAANNQQEDQKTNTQSRILHDLGILYCPDYIVNAAGVIWVAKVGEPYEQTVKDIREGVPRRFESLLENYDENGHDDMATLAANFARDIVTNGQT